MITTTLQKLNTHLLSQRDITKVFIGVCLMTICSNIQIPLEPVPITLQSVGVLFIGLMYTPKNAFLSLLSFVMLGALGAPIFAGFVGGPLKVMGPTAGYIWSWPLVAFIVAYLNMHVFQEKWYMMMINILLGTVIIYTFGVAWLYHFVGSAEKAIATGLLPFILPGIVKAIILTLCIYGLKKSLQAKQ